MKTSISHNDVFSNFRFLRSKDTRDNSHSMRHLKHSQPNQAELTTFWRILEGHNRSLIIQQTAKEFFRCIVRMSHGRSYLLWDDILTEKLDSLTIDANVKQTGVLTLDTSLEDREESQPSSSQFTCGTCGVQLAGRDEQIEHYKSEEHRHRIKSKLRARFDSLSRLT